MLERTRKNLAEKSMQPLNRIRQLLHRQQKKVEEEIKTIEADDPVLSSDTAESSEPGTDSWMADVHSRAVALKQNLYRALDSTKKALLNIKLGRYGKCDNCGKSIEEGRLKVMPTATLCISCSKKKTTKK